MKNLITILVMLVAVGCSKSPEEKLVRTYVLEADGRKMVLLENGTVEKYKNGEKTDDFEWKIVGKEVHLGDGMPPVSVGKIEPNGDLTAIAEIDGGGRKDYSKEDQVTFKKIKVEPKETPSNSDDKITYDPVSDEEAITGADRLARVCVKALAGKNHELLLQQNPNSLPDEDYKQWAKAIWFANLERMKKEVSDMLKVFEDPDPEMKAILVKLQTDPDKVFDDDLKQQLEMRKLSKDGPRMETAKKEFISERTKLTVAESDWGKVAVSKVKIVRFRQRNVMKEIPFPNRQVEVTLEYDPP